MTAKPPHAAHLHAVFDMPPPAVLAHALRSGRLELPLCLENHSAYPAQFPFICVMDLGLHVRPEANWAVSRISSDGRKLLRYAFTQAATLRPGDRLRAMCLVLHILPGAALRVALNGTAPVPLDTLRDIRLFSICGAANFPAERGTIRLSADALRRSLAPGLAEPELQRAS